MMLGRVALVGAFWGAMGFTVACSRSGDTKRAAQTSRDTSSTLHALTIGAPVPAYDVTTLRDSVVHLGGTQDDVTILNVWATWCTECREEMALLDTVARQTRKEHVRVISVSVDQSIAPVRQFAQIAKPSFVIGYDARHEFEQSYSVVALPTTYVIGRDGHLVWQHTGSVVAVRHELSAAIDQAENPQR